jgi:cytochrome c biogenesis protein CcmG, thiol:disulfide interchange protein DsbE
MNSQSVPPPPLPTSNELPAAPKKSGAGKILVIGAAVLVGATALTFITSKKDDKKVTSVATTAAVPGKPGATAAASAAVAAAPAENQPVTIVGDALKPLPDSGTDPAVGTVAPTIEGRDFTGKAVTIKPGDGKAKLILFVAHWCPHCQREVPRIVKWANDGSIPKSIEVVAVSTGVKTDQNNFPPSAWLAKENWPGAIVADDTKSQAALAYGLTGFPFFALVDGTGKVVARDSGEKELQEIQALVAKVAV